MQCDHAAYLNNQVRADLKCFLGIFQEIFSNRFFMKLLTSKKYSQ